MHQHRQRRRTNCKLVNVVQITEMTNYGLGELKLWCTKEKNIQKMAQSKRKAQRRALGGFVARFNG